MLLKSTDHAKYDSRLIFLLKSKMELSIFVLCGLSMGADKKYVRKDTKIYRKSKRCVENSDHFTISLVRAGFMMLQTIG